MPSDLNRVLLIGRLVRDPELRSTPAGTSVASFSIANNRVYTANNEKKEQVSYFNCIAWGKLGELVVQYCKRGNRIAVEGRLQQRSWDNKDGNKQYAVEVVTDNVQFLSPKGSQGESSMDMNASVSYQDIPQSQGIETHPFADDDIPF